ncbi:MAG TPA: beta-propeller fold lactonase family protein [Kofleriaceae bacterium]|jgi:6-phosphogluconolactonase (cycloisomerase 2 family)
MLKLTSIAILLLGACASDGSDGMDGMDGTNGANGTNGSNGSDGTDGTNGTNGANGADAPDVAPHGLYTLANQAAGNNVASFLRGENGNLTRDTEWSTGGMGSGSGLGSQGGLVWDKKTARFFAVNAGNNTISMMSIDGDGALSVLATIASGGVKPISIAVHDDLVYVLNYGDVSGTHIADNTVNANITGFKVVGTTLTAIAGSTRALSGTGDVHPTDLVFTPDGKHLVVAERFGTTMTGRLDTYEITAGVAQAGNFQSPAGHQPFAITFSPEGFMLVAEVGDATPAGSSASSYSVGATGTLTAITSSLPTLQGAACWIVSVGGFAYLANTATANITGLNVSPTGALTLHDANGVTATSGMSPIDLAVSPERGYLYSLAGTSHTVSIFSIASDGSLSPQPALTGLAAGTSGLVAR